MTWEIVDVSKQARLTIRTVEATKLTIYDVFGRWLVNYHVTSLILTCVEVLFL